MLTPWLASQSRGEDQLAQTPDWLMERLHAEFAFDFDPCPSDWRPGCGWSGLEIDWGSSSYVNPPYDSCGDWLAKAVRERQTRGCGSVFLIPFRPWTVYWREWVWPHASEVRLLDHTVAFKGYGDKRLPTALCLVVYYAPLAPLRVLDRFSRPARLLVVPEPCRVSTLAEGVLVHGAGYAAAQVRVLMGSLNELLGLVAAYQRDRATPLVAVFAARCEAQPFLQAVLPHCDDLYFTHPVLKGDDTGQRLYSGSVVAVFDTNLTRRARLAAYAAPHTLLFSTYDASVPDAEAGASPQR